MRINMCGYSVLCLKFKNNKLVKDNDADNSGNMLIADSNVVTMFNVSDIIDQYNFKNNQCKTLTDYLTQNYNLICHAIQQNNKGFVVVEFDENNEYNYSGIFQTVKINDKYYDQMFCEELFISLLTWLNPNLAYDIQHFIIQVRNQTVTNSKKICNNNSRITVEKIKPSIDVKTIQKSTVQPKLYLHSSNQMKSNLSYVISKIDIGTSYIYIKGECIETRKLTKNIIKNPNNIIIHGIDSSHSYKDIVHRELKKIFTSNAYPGLIETPSMFFIPEKLSDKLNDKSVTKKIVNVLLRAARISQIPVNRRIISSYDELIISTNTNITDYVSYMLKAMFEWKDSYYDDIPFDEYDSDISSDSDSSESYDYESEHDSTSSDKFNLSDDDYESDYTNSDYF